MNNHRILPFYMTYPMPLFYQEEDSVQRDLEYLQQMYPAQAKRYQRKVASILDKIDYEGSMIYDEYPDRMRLYQLAEDILNQIKREDMEENGEKDENPEKWSRIGEMIQVLLFYEIYRRRHTNHRGILKF
ncbi:MAG: hypothetical protein K2K54_09085 [Lachnospiraceae bacterium]|nr:hypothetical protein [Lachnospiraceae bacterium]